MILVIGDRTTIKDIQQEFQKAYPFLDIRFSDRPHEFGTATNKGHWYDADKRLFDITEISGPGYVYIQPWSKTWDVEEQFKTRFKLYPQIFRKEDDQWVQTAGTDDFTLEEQNEIGKQSLERRNGNLWIEREKFL